MQCTSEKPQCRSCINSGRWCRGYGEQARSSPAAPSAPLIASISPRHAFRQQLFSVYLSKHLPDEVAAKSNRERNWLLQVPGMPSLDSSLEAAVFAVCTARLGKQDANQDLIHKSMASYYTGIRELQKAIHHPRTRWQEQTLAACFSLAMYELSECPGQMAQGYLSHYNGAPWNCCDSAVRPSMLLGWGTAYCGGFGCTR